MGYLPIFLYLASFVFLFLLVVNNSIKNKRKQFEATLAEVAARLKGYAANGAGTGILSEAKSLEEADQQYQTLRASIAQDPAHSAWLTQTKMALGRLKQQQYWYNNLIKSMPYSIVAKLFGHKAL
ncbi:MAG TPA: hypothetical protein VK014_03235 [Cyclobacteriaceae bacterium]|nr:hypothetical protein [Cyclobacteriaceae bacterium]